MNIIKNVFSELYKPTPSKKKLGDFEITNISPEEAQKFPPLAPPRSTAILSHIIIRMSVLMFLGSSAVGTENRLKVSA